MKHTDERRVRYRPQRGRYTERKDNPREETKGMYMTKEDEEWYVENVLRTMTELEVVMETDSNVAEPVAVGEVE